MKKKFRIVALAGFPTALVAAACGSLLDIDDRELDTEGDGGVVSPPTGNDGGGPANGTDGDIVLEPAEASIPPLQGTFCDDAACTTAGGQCANRGASGRICEFNCNGTCAFNCPPSNDCEIKCAKDKNSCKNSTCTGGKSCTFICSAQESCSGTQCEGTICRFDCNAKEACSNVKGTATNECFIDCRGEKSCGGDRNSCFAPSAQISCTGPKAETCAGRPFCAPKTQELCTLNCTVKEGCSSYCCDTDGGGSCKFEGSFDGNKNCSK